MDEAIRHLVERIRSLRPETVQLLSRNPKMQFELFREVVGPLFADYATFEVVERLASQGADQRPLFWRPDRKWIPEAEDEAGDP